MRVDLLQKAAVMGQFTHPKVLQLFGVVLVEVPVSNVLPYACMCRTIPHAPITIYVLSIFSTYVHCHNGMMYEIWSLGHKPFEQLPITEVCR